LVRGCVQLFFIAASSCHESAFLQRLTQCRFYLVEQCMELTLLCCISLPENEPPSGPTILNGLPLAYPRLFWTSHYATYCSKRQALEHRAQASSACERGALSTTPEHQDNFF